MNSKTPLILQNWLYIKSKPDLKIIGKCGQYSCHRIIILCLSPYFQRLLEYKNQLTDGFYTLDMTDISTLSLLSIINFAYKSSIEINEDNVEDLMISADKYNILSILNRCEQFLWQSIDTDNCFDYYMLAHFYNCDRLKARIKQFIFVRRLIGGWKNGLPPDYDTTNNRKKFLPQWEVTDEDVMKEWQRRRDSKSE